MPQALQPGEEGTNLPFGFSFGSQAFDVTGGSHVQIAIIGDQIAQIHHTPQLKTLQSLDIFQLRAPSDSAESQQANACTDCLPESLILGVDVSARHGV